MSSQLQHLVSATRFTSISVQDPLDKEGISRHNYIQEK